MSKSFSEMNIFYELSAMARAQLAACLSYVPVEVSNSAVLQSLNSLAKKSTML